MWRSGATSGSASAAAGCAVGGVAHTGYNAFGEPTPDSMTAADDRGPGHAAVHRPGGLDGPPPAGRRRGRATHPPRASPAAARGLGEPRGPRGEVARRRAPDDVRLGGRGGALRGEGGGAVRGADGAAGPAAGRGRTLGAASRAARRGGAAGRSGLRRHAGGTGATSV